MQSNLEADRYYFFSKAFLKVSIFVLLSSFCIGMIYYFAFIRGINTVFTHFFYVPIALAGFLWGRKSIWVAIFLGMCLMIPYVLSVLSTTFFIEDILRVLMFIVIAWVIGSLREYSLYNEKKLADIVEGSPIPTFVVNKDHTITHFNCACETLTGISAEDIVGSRKQWMTFYMRERPILADLIIDGASEEVIDRYYSGKCQKSPLIQGAYEGEVFNNEVGEDGRWLHITVASIRNNKDEVIGAIETLLDITERKRVEEALRESEERYRRLVELSPDAVIINSEGKIVFANMATAKLIGVASPEELIGKLVMDWVHPDYWEIVKGRIWQTQEQKKEVPLIEEKFIRLDGSVVDVEVAAIPFTHQGKPAAQVIAREITERKKAEEALRESEERYRLLVELSPDAIFAHREGKFIFANWTAAKLLGIESPGKLINKSIKDIIHPDYRKIVKERIEKIQEEGKEVPLIEEKLIRFDGTVVDVEVAGTSFPYKGKLANLTVARDITDRKRVEELQKSAEENKRLLKEAIKYDMLKTEFFSNISHELKTPLNVIFSTTQLLDLYLKDNLIADNGHKVNKRINSMKQNCNRLLRLVNNLIDITKIDVGFFEIQLQNHNIVSVVEEITLSVAEYTENKGIALNFDTDIEEKIMACDPNKIERIILNLLSNAVKFTKPGGNIMVNMHDRGESIVISVIDTGIGIPEDKLDVIFERFRQVDKLLTRKREGSGIGLSLVKSLVEMHGGRITVESECGKGSEFTIELPVKVLLEEENTIQIQNNDMKQGYIERINIEFSDIYSLS